MAKQLQTVASVMASAVASEVCGRPWLSHEQKAESRRQHSSVLNETMAPTAMRTVREAGAPFVCRNSRASVRR